MRRPYPPPAPPDADTMAFTYQALSGCSPAEAQDLQRLTRRIATRHAAASVIYGTAGATQFWFKRIVEALAAGDSAAQVLRQAPGTDTGPRRAKLPAGMANLTFRLEGGAEITRGIRATIANSRDLTPVWDTVVDDFRELQDQQFDRGGPPSRRWRRNDPRWRRRKGGQPVGVYRGALQRSLTTRATGAVEQRNATNIVLGSRVPHAHLFAAARPILTVVNRNVTAQWADLVAEAIGAPLIESGRVRAVRSRGRRRRRPPRRPA